MAKVSRKTLREQIKGQYITMLMAFLSDSGEEILRTKSNEFCFPVVDSEGNEDFVKITVAIPIGGNKGTEPYDGYGEAESYQMKLVENERKAKEKEKKKAEKIERDRAYREKKEQMKKRKEG